MNDQTQDTIVRAGTPEIYKGKLVLALSKVETTIQGLHNAESALVYNEDNLDKIGEFVEKGKKALKIIEDERIRLKEPSLLEGKNIDAGAKLISVDLQALVNKADKKKQEISAQKAARALIEKEAEDKKIATLALIDNFIITYTEKIASSTTISELVGHERMINLETANEKRYGEYLPAFKTRAAAIRTLLAAQKLSVSQLAVLEKVVTTATETGADDKAMEAMDKIDEIKATIYQQKINIVETGVGQATNSGYAEQVKTESPKPARRSWKYLAIDLPLLYKKNPELVILTLNDEAIKKLMKEKQEKKELKDEVINGLKIYHEIKY